MPKSSTGLIALFVTPDEAALLHRSFINGIHGGRPEVVQSLTVKIEKAFHHATAVRALTATKELARGEKAARV